MPHRRRALMLVNPQARAARSQLARAVREALGALGWQVDQMAPETPEAAAAIVADLAPGALDVLAIAGGDGAVRVAAGALRPDGPPLAIVPSGAANIAALDLGLPTAPDAIAAMIDTGDQARLSLGRANGAPFLVTAGVGLSGYAAAWVDPATKSRFGRAAYWLAIARAAAAAPTPQLRLTIDGASATAAWALTGNARLRPGSLAAYGGDGLRLAFSPADSPAERAGVLVGVAAGRLSAVPGVRVMRFTSALVEADVPEPCQIDGESFGATPLRLESAGAVRVIVRPAAAA